MLSDDEIIKIGRTIELRFEELSKEEAATDERPPDALHHYTSAEGLLGIVRSGQIWATNLLYLNDSSELSDALKILASEIEAIPLKLGDFAGTFSKSISFYSKDVALDHFVTSFCQDGDLLGQWRGYGAQGAGYSIGFVTPALLSAAKRRENNDRGACTLRKVKYTLKQKMQMIQRRISTLNEILEPVADELEPALDEEFRRLILLWHQIAASFRPTLALMKHASFEEENEWRLVRTLWRRSVPTVEWPVQVRTIRGQLAPYLPLSWALPNTSNPPEVQGIREVRCGPSLEPELKEKAVHDLLIAQNCWRVPVLRSQVPLRA
jgi:hypothetical protein